MCPGKTLWMKGGIGVNGAALRSIMMLNGDTYKTLAKFLGITANSFCNKINENGTEFKQGEIAAIKERYSLTADQIEAIFFS